MPRKPLFPIDVPATKEPDEDVRVVHVLDAGHKKPLERYTFVNYYANALAVLLELHFGTPGGVPKRTAEMASSVTGNS